MSHKRKMVRPRAERFEGTPAQAGEGVVLIEFKVRGSVTPKPPSSPLKDRPRSPRLTDLWSDPQMPHPTTRRCSKLDILQARGIPVDKSDCLQEPIVDLLQDGTPHPLPRLVRKGSRMPCRLRFPLAGEFRLSPPRSAASTLNPTPIFISVTLRRSLHESLPSSSRVTRKRYEPILCARDHPAAVYVTTAGELSGSLNRFGTS